MSDSSRVLLVHFGDPGSLASAATIRLPERAVVWHPALDGPGDASRRRAAAATAASIGAGPPIVDLHARVPVAAGAGAEVRVAADLALLARAAAVAGQRGCSRMIWPVQRGQLASAVLAAIEPVECLLDALEAGVGRGAERGEGADGPLVIELPVVDLDDDQVLDLIDASGVPWAGAWPCSDASDEACGACSGCRRWRRAAGTTGLDDPWEPAGEGVRAGPEAATLA